MLSASPQQFLSASAPPCAFSWPQLQSNWTKAPRAEPPTQGQLKLPLLKVFPSGVLSQEEQGAGLTDPRASRKMAVPSNFLRNTLTSHAMSRGLKKNVRFLMSSKQTYVFINKPGSNILATFC